MKALIHDGKGTISLQEKERPSLQNPKDAIIRVTLSSICTSDLHILNGAVPQAAPNTVLGHEFVGIVEEVGAEVSRFAPGDRVAVNVETFCGTCFFCQRGWVNNCVEGGWKLGCTIDGCQAEFVRVPYAENALTPIPDLVSDDQALFVGDVLATGWWGAKIGEITTGSSVAVIGAGPVGLTSMMCAKLYHPEKIIALDVSDYRLSVAQNNTLADAIINPNGKTLNEIESLIRKQTHGRGADVVIEAAGGNNTFEMAWRIARPNAVVVLSAMYEQNQMLPLPSMYGKNLVFKTGGVDAYRLDEIMHRIESGELDTTCLISKRYPLNRIEEAYGLFSKRPEDCLKIAITPWNKMAPTPNKPPCLLRCFNTQPPSTPNPPRCFGTQVRQA